MTELHALAADMDAVNRANGFDAPTIENLPGKLMLACTELAEIDEAAAGHGDLHEELADLLLRLLSVMHGTFGDGWADRVTGSIGRVVRPEKPYAFERIETLVWPICLHLFRATERWRKQRDDDAMWHMELAVLQLWRLCNKLGFDVIERARVKLEINRQREPLHGNARSL